MVVAPAARQSFATKGARGYCARRHRRGTGLPAIESLISVWISHPDTSTTATSSWSPPKGRRTQFARASSASTTVPFVARLQIRSGGAYLVRPSVARSRRPPRRSASNSTGNASPDPISGFRRWWTVRSLSSPVGVMSHASESPTLAPRTRSPSTNATTAVVSPPNRRAASSSSNSKSTVHQSVEAASVVSLDKATIRRSAAAAPPPVPPAPSATATK